MRESSRRTTLCLIVMLCLPSCMSNPPAVVNSVCGRYAKIAISDASAVHLTDGELLAIVNHNDKIAADCP